MPAVGDYDGDRVWEFGTITRNARNLVWKVRSTNGEVLGEDIFGRVGDKPITGCAFLSNRKSSLAVIRKNKIVAKELKNIKEIESDNFLNGEFIGCIDADEDGVDEIVWTKKDSTSAKTRVFVTTFKGKNLTSEIVPDFDKGFVVKNALAKSVNIALVKLVKAKERRATFLLEDGNSETFFISLPRKVVVSSGSSLNADGTANLNLIWQDLLTGQLRRQVVALETKVEDVGRVSKQSTLLQVQSLYQTE